MADPNRTSKIAFAPHFEVRTLDARRVLLLSEDRSFLLTGKLYVAMAPYLDGSRTRDEIVAALRSTTAAPPDRIEQAMSTLLAKKYATPVVPGARAAFWAELAVDPSTAERRVAATRVAVRALGTSPGADALAASQLVDALAEAGFPPDDNAGEPSLTMVLVEDYLAPALDPVNREMRRARRRWLPVKATGRVAWLGPIFDPPDGPCWACLAKRVSENRPGEMRTAHGEPVPRVPRGDFPVARGIALNLAVLELARATAGDAGAALAGSHLLTFDLKSLVFTRHAVHRQVVCPVCGVEAGMVADDAVGVAQQWIHP